MSDIEDYVDRAVDIALGVDESGKFPEKIHAELKRIADGDFDFLRSVFPPQVSDESIRENAEYITAGADYYKLGYHVHFDVSAEFDLNKFLGDLLSMEDGYLEVCMTVFEDDGPEEGITTMLVGQTAIDDTENYEWKLLLNYRFSKWIASHDNKKQHYLDGESIVIAGHIDEYEDDDGIEEIEEEILELGGKYEKELSKKTTLLIVGRDPDHSLVDAAIEKNIPTVSEKFLLGFFGLETLDILTGVERFDDETEYDDGTLPKDDRTPLIANEIIDIYKKYNLKFDEELLDVDDVYSLQSVLHPLEKYEICCIEMGEAPGSWVSGKLHTEFSYIIKNVVKASKGKVKIENFVSKNEPGKPESEGNINISFDHKGKQYSWSFHMDEYVDYFTEILEWAEMVLGDGYHEEGEDFLTAWYIDPGALKELTEKVNEHLYGKAA